jgi:hypothetical protein
MYRYLFRTCIYIIYFIMDNVAIPFSSYPSIDPRLFILGVFITAYIHVPNFGI